MPPIQDQHVQSQPDYSPDRIENPFVIPGIRKTKIDSNLNGTYVFERYIEGDCNRLARSAAMAIYDNPVTNSFNPYFINGPTGLVKTHLVQIICNRIKHKYGRKIGALHLIGSFYQ